MGQYTVCSWATRFWVLCVGVVPWFWVLCVGVVPWFWVLCVGVVHWFWVLCVGVVHWFWVLCVGVVHWALGSTSLLYSVQPGYYWTRSDENTPQALLMMSVDMR